ncbi:MAG TPA: AgmX/PglI C-terminal domain-containing protein [Steroidobacteraceae bacterium]|nr:AgmX/PglI C-terminal domain-containing protein [Steroidobacteraceae bacterium]
MLRPYFREFELPWNINEEERERFRKILLWVLGLVLLLAILIPLLPLPERKETTEEQIPPRLARLMLEKKEPPPPPPPPKEEKKPEVKKEAKPEPKPVDRQQEARKKAAVAGLLPFKDELADLRDNRMVDIATANRPLTDAAHAGDLAQRSMITSKVGQGSGGINTAALSRGFGGGGGGLTGRATTTVSSGIGQGDPKAVRSGSGQKASRSREEIELVFDKNKSAIYALYNRALRDKPDLQGKIVLELTIAPWGEVTNCRVVSSDLNDPELERKLVARVKLFRFEDRDVEAVTTTKPIDFFPA